MKKPELQTKHDEICTYFLECKSVKDTAQHFSKHPEYIRRVLAKNGIDFYEVRADYIARNPRGAGRKSTGKRRQVTLTGLSDAAADKLDEVENMSRYLVGLIEKDIAKID